MNIIIEKRNYIILFLIIVLLLWLGMIKNNRIFLKSYNFDKKTITVAIYDRVNVKKVSDRIDKIYKKYEKIQAIDEISYDSEIIFDVNDRNIILSLATNKVINYLKSKGITKYIINANGNIIAGKKYGENKYNISISDPDNDEILKIVSFENKSMVTINDGMYDTLIVICDDIIKATITAQNISNLNTEEGREYALKHGCDVFWYKNGKIIMTDNFKKYII